jgi:hypothetical protein
MVVKTFSDMTALVSARCRKRNVSTAALARRIGCTPRRLRATLAQEDVKLATAVALAASLGLELVLVPIEHAEKIEAVVCRGLLL